MNDYKDVSLGGTPTPNRLKAHKCRTVGRVSSPYFRAGQPLPPEALADLEKYYSLLRTYYQIPDNQPVFPKLPKEYVAERPPKAKRKATGKNRNDHPWRST